MLTIIQKIPDGAAGTRFFTTSHGMAGYFAVEMWWNEDHGGFWEPWDTGIGRYRTRKAAYEEAKTLANIGSIPLMEERFD